MTETMVSDTTTEDGTLSPTGRRALFAAGLGALASLLLPAEKADAAVVVLRPKRPVVVVARPRRRVIVVR